VLLDQETGRQGLYVNPKNLLGALWVQLAESIDKGQSSKRCSECGEWMLLAPGTSRSDREFCSDRCRVNAFRKRKKPAARLYRKGMAPSAIAKMLGSDSETVRGWLGLAKKGQ
jgi:transposase-like protein